VKLFQEWGRIKENDGGVNSTMRYYKDFAKYQPAPTIKKLKI
jgi:hypothetical protein